MSWQWIYAFIPPTVPHGAGLPPGYTPVPLHWPGGLPSGGLPSGGLPRHPTPPAFPPPQGLNDATLPDGPSIGPSLSETKGTTEETKDIKEGFKSTPNAGTSMDMTDVKDSKHAAIHKNHTNETEPPPESSADSSDEMEEVEDTDKDPMPRKRPRIVPPPTKSAPPPPPPPAPETEEWECESWSNSWWKRGGRTGWDRGWGQDDWRS